jgi:hypothetical protein
MKRKKISICYNYYQTKNTHSIIFNILKKQTNIFLNTPDPYFF